VKRRFQGRIVLFACDFTPVEYESYFRELLSSIPPDGLIVDSQYSAVVGLLRGGRYNTVSRDFRSGRKAAYESLKRLCTA
jgi:hypothetical protein